MSHQSEYGAEHAVAKGLVQTFVSYGGEMTRRLRGLTSVAYTLGRNFMSHEPHQEVQAQVGAVVMAADPYRMGSTALPDDAKWRLEYPRNPEECIAALEVARRIRYPHWSVVGEILRNQPAKRNHAYRDRVLEGAAALGIEFEDVARPSGEPRRHFRLPK